MPGPPATQIRWAHRWCACGEVANRPAHRALHARHVDCDGAFGGPRRSLDGSAIAALGVDEWKFLKPILFGDTVHLRATIVSARPTLSRTAASWCAGWSPINQRGEVVQSGLMTTMVLTRAGAAIEAQQAPGKLREKSDDADEPVWSVRRAAHDARQRAGVCDALAVGPGPQDGRGTGVPQEADQALAEAGYLGLFYPEHLGGMGGTHKDLAVLLETLGYYYTGIAEAGDDDLYLRRHACREVRPARWCRRRSSQRSSTDWVKLALAMSEPGTGLDVAGIKTTAVREGDEYGSNGNKVWITCAHVADYIVVIGEDGPPRAAAPGHEHAAGRARRPRA